jgi:competence protein ComEA
MFRGASLNTQPIPDGPPPERRSLVVPWCWPAGARVLLAVLAITAGLGLRQASQDVPSLPPTDLAPHLLLDVNEAPPRVLAALPHVGPALTRRLVEARIERPFVSLNDIGDRVHGVGPVTLARLAPYLDFESTSIPRRERLASGDGMPSAVKPKALRRKTTRTKRLATTTVPPRLTAMATASQAP